ncbi:MAG: glutamate synthase [Proteobacteria bacterium]|nr:glutamate synthase [Pseudomonadota bacterium]
MGKLNLLAQEILRSRKYLGQSLSPLSLSGREEEGGCGVTGFACSVPVSGRHIFEPSVQMHNRGNGKGGGIAAVGLSAETLGVSEEILKDSYLLLVAYLDSEARRAVEDEFITPCFQIHHSGKISTVKDYRDVPGLEVKPPDVWRYFVRLKENALKDFIRKNAFTSLTLRQAEDEFIYQNTFHLNKRFYASLGEKKAFVLSHGRDMMIMKIVGYAEQVVKYYQLEDFKAHIWIAHQRYPTKGRVWHPGGAHPFIGLNEALVHNGDFANYYSVTEYLRQRNIFPLFLTDTEVAVLLFDLWNRIYQYPLEYIIEAMAPTTEMDFDLLPEQKQKIYRALQAVHIHGSPDGPWFFIIARNNPDQNHYQLLGITDTSMLRPQVFAIQEGEIQIGLICSEKQAIDATLHSLSEEDSRFHKVADRYWNARGGSHTDGGAFIFTVRDSGNSHKVLTCTDKFGRVITTLKDQVHHDRTLAVTAPGESEMLKSLIENFFERQSAFFLFEKIRGCIASWDYNTFRFFCQEVVKKSKEGDREKGFAIEFLTLLHDCRYDTGKKKRSSILEILEESLYEIFERIPFIRENSASTFCRIDWATRDSLRVPREVEKTLVLNGKDFPPEGDDCDARLLCEAYRLGWKRFIAYDYRGQRFCGSGIGPNTQGVRIDVYGSSGDYLGSSIDGLEIYVHGNGQDQLGQILKRGKLVVFGDVGQTFMYGAKGGEVYVMGNAAGRPLINAVGKPRVVINGTCLDYLAESFMAGDPLNGGGFVVLNGMEFNDRGEIREQSIPYPGSNLFSLASGGAIYLRDPYLRINDDQLNGGSFLPLTPDDWKLILPYLTENERLFDISVEHDLLTVDGEIRKPEEVYRKVGAVKLSVLAKVEDDVD